MFRSLASFFIFVVIGVVTSLSCYAQINQSPSAIEINAPKDSVSVSKANAATIKPVVKSSYYDMKFDAAQVSQYIRRIFQDSKGNLWFGTVGDGICRYDGKALTYFTVKDGFSGVSVQAITEDKDGNLWFGTSGGITKYDGTHFVTYTEKEGLPSNFIFSMLIDRTGMIWVGTNEGVCRYNPSVKVSSELKMFTSFPFPEAVEKDLGRGTSPKIIWNMLEDKTGNIWFASNGGGVYKYQSVSGDLINISKKDGLASNFVFCILQDKKGNLWFGTQGKGVSRYNPSAVVGLVSPLLTHFTDKECLGDVSPLTMLEDKKGNLWLPGRGGMCRYSPQTPTTAESFATFNDMDGLTNYGVQSIFEDQSGKLWFGTGAGLFRFDGRLFINVTKDGPWEHN